MIHRQKKKLRRPGIEPGTDAWKASMLTITPPTLVYILWVTYARDMTAVYNPSFSYLS